LDWIEIKQGRTEEKVIEMKIEGSIKNKQD
jgi:hypothetical protein